MTVLALALIAISGANAHAQMQSLDQDLATGYTKLVQECQKHQVDKLVVESFTTEPNLAPKGTNAAGATLYFEKKLKENHFYSAQSEYKLEGKIDCLNHPGNVQQELLRMSIVKKFSLEIVTSFVITVKGAIPPRPSTVPGTPPPVPTSNGPEERVQLPPRNAPFEMQIFRKKAGEWELVPTKLVRIPRKIADGDNQKQIYDEYPFADVNLNDVLKIKLINKAPFMVVVQLKIDGLNVLSDFVLTDPSDAAQQQKAKEKFPNGIPQLLILGGKDGQNTPDPKKFPPEQEMLGWVTSLDQQAEFTIVDYPQSVAGLRRATTDVGVISASFWAAWYGPTRPSLQIEGIALQAGGPSERAVGAGQLVDKRIVMVDRPQMDPKPIWIATVRYSRDANGPGQ